MNNIWKIVLPTIMLVVVLPIVLNLANFCWSSNTIYSENDRKNMALEIAYERIKHTHDFATTPIVMQHFIANSEVTYMGQIGANGIFISLIGGIFGLSAIEHKIVYSNKEIYVFQDNCGLKLDVYVEN